MDYYYYLGPVPKSTIKAILGITSLRTYTAIQLWFDPIHNSISGNLGLGIYHSTEHIYVEVVGSVCVYAHEKVSIWGLL